MKSVDSPLARFRVCMASGVRQNMGYLLVVVVGQQEMMEHEWNRAPGWGGDERERSEKKEVV